MEFWNTILLKNISFCESLKTNEYGKVQASITLNTDVLVKK